MNPYSSAADAKERFSSRVDAYVKARPRYPRGVIDQLNAAIGFDSSWHVVDVGSGTGISCELFLQNDNPVTAVEPNAPMREAAEKALGWFAKFRSVDGSAEATTLPDACCDLVVAAQAFHWFDLDQTRREFGRILRPGGWVLIMWNNRQLTSTPFLRDYEQLLQTFGTDYTMVKHRHVSMDQKKFAAFFGHAEYRRIEFSNAQHLDYAGLEARLLSSSYTPTPGNPRHQPMLASLRDLFDRHHRDGQVTIEYRTELFFGQLGPR